jgi:hypothetical protein
MQQDFLSHALGHGGVETLNVRTVPWSDLARTQWEHYACVKYKTLQPPIHPHFRVESRNVKGESHACLGFRWQLPENGCFALSKPASRGLTNLRCHGKCTTR